MDVITNLMGGFATCLTPYNLWMAALGAFLGNDGRDPPRPRPLGDDGHHPADHLRHGPDPGDDHALRPLLRGDVRRLHHLDPRQRPRGGLLGRHGDRGPPARPAGEGGNGPGPLRHRLLLRRHHRHDLPRLHRLHPRRVQPQVRPGRNVQPRPHGDVHDHLRRRQGHHEIPDEHGDRPRPRHRRDRHRRGQGPLHLRDIASSWTASISSSSSWGPSASPRSSNPPRSS